MKPFSQAPAIKLAEKYQGYSPFKYIVYTDRMAKTAVTERGHSIDTNR